MAIELSVLFSMALSVQTVIDATVPVRKRLRNPTAGQAGSVGRKLPIQIAVELPSLPLDAEGTLTVTFVLTNSGDKPLIIPVSPHPGDLEPKEKSMPYTVQHLYLYLSLNKDNEPVLPGGAHLYGNEGQPETLLGILPGKSVRVLARIQMPPGLTSHQGIPALVAAHAVLDREALKTVHDQTFIDTQEIGSAASPPFSLQSHGGPQ